MRLRKLVVVGLVGFVSFAANLATAEDAAAPSSYVGADGVSFADLAGTSGGRFEFNLSDGGPSRFSNLGAPATRTTRDPAYRRYELAVVARAPAGIDVAFAQRGGVGFDEQGDINRASRSSELRLGRGLRNLPRDRPSAMPSWYFFAAAEDEALVWRPGASNAFGDAGPSFALQDRVEIGDRQAGITYERNGLQASLAYVEREVSVRNGSHTMRQDENFAGITLTMRR